MFRHKFRTINLAPQRFNTIPFKRYIFFLCKLNHYIVTRHKTYYQSDTRLFIRFATFYVCWLEDAVCSEIKNENTIEHCRLPQCNTKHRNIMSKYIGSINFKHN